MSQTITITGADDIEDTWIDSVSPTLNYGAHAGTLITRTLGAFLLRIKKGRLAVLLGSSALIESMQVGIYLNGSADENDKTMAIYKVLRDWVAGTLDGEIPDPGAGATFNKYDGTNDWQTAGCLGALDRDATVLDQILVDCFAGTTSYDRLTHGFRELTIPLDIARSWYIDETTNNGIIARLLVSNQFIHAFTTDEAITRTAHPYFRITYNYKTRSANKYNRNKALNRIAPGGKWSVKDALDISDQAHVAHQVAADTKAIKIRSDSTVYYTWDMSSSDTISTANDDYLLASTIYTIEVPEIGQQPYIHFKQVSSAATKYIRIVEL